MEPAWKWEVGDPIGTGSDIGAPEVPYMSYGPKLVESREEIEEREKEEERQRELDELERKSRNISKEALELCQEGKYSDAIVFINRALDYCNWLADPWNVRAIILEDMNFYEDALKNYDEAIKFGSSEVYRHNKARCLVRYSRLLSGYNDNEKALELIDDSLEIFETLKDKDYEDRAWNLKGMLLERFNDFEGAFDCYKKALEISTKDNDMKPEYKKNRDRLIGLIDSSEKTCPKCGGRLEITDNFCLKCGTRVDGKKTP